MTDLFGSQKSNYLKLRESSNDKNKLINNRGDFVSVYSPTQINVNGKVHHSTSSALTAIGKWGKK